MNQRTDLGWFTYGVDMPSSNLTGITVSGGVFSATSINTDPSFWLLDTGHPDAANLGKTGKRFPIVSSRYQRMVMKMKLTGTAISTSNPSFGRFYWSNNTIYDPNGPPGGLTESRVFTSLPGSWIYSVNLQALGVSYGTPWTSANVDSLRLDPVTVGGVNISLDWARLVEDVPENYRTIQWTGSGAVDIFLDDDTNPNNGLLAQIARSATGNTHSFYAGGLPQGTYRVVICQAGAAGPYSYAPGSWLIQDIPLLTFSSPSPQGSSDEFASTQLNNAWDMDTLSDLDHQRYINNLQITTIPAENEQGDSLGSVRVLQGTSVAYPGLGADDPHVYPLWHSVRGASTSIDSDRYRILTLEMGVEGNRDINLGSVARIVWQNKGGGENVSEDIIVRHLPGANVIQTINLDMKALELDALSQTSRVGWVGLVNSFRVDPHEFSDARKFWIKSIRLAALERATSTYSIRWAYTAQGSPGVTLSLFRDTTGKGFGGTEIVTGLDPSSGSYVWDVSAIPSGTYHVYGVLKIGGTVVNQAYATWPVVVEHPGQVLPTIALGRPALIFGATSGGATVTGPQEISVNVKGTGAVDWTVTTNRPWLVVSPASGRGTGRFTVSVQSTSFPAPSSQDGVVTVTATGAANSPQTVSVSLKVISTGATATPFGSFDTPANNTAGVSGSIAVTGWALDDVGVNSVTIWRDPVGPEPTNSNGYIYIGDAMFVPDARPDVEALSPTSPRAYRAGWGYMMLTYGLPNANGTFRLHAIATDAEGKQVKLGTKTITVDNLHSVKPFGALDTPFPGQTISGTFANSGWALTPQPSAIATDGSTIWVSVDGVDLAHPFFGFPRADVAAMFPGYANSNSNAGYYNLDTTRFTNAMHAISWNVYDNRGHGDGIGSRFFQIMNGATATSADPMPEARETAEQAIDEERRFQLRAARLLHPRGAVASFPAFRRGYHRDAALTPIRQAGEGLLEPVEIQELDRLEIHLPGWLSGGQPWAAWLRAGDELRELPIGSTFDAEGGIFYWQLGAGFLGEFHLEFRAGDGTTIPILVRVGAPTAPIAIQ